MTAETALRPPSRNMRAAEAKPAARLMGSRRVFLGDWKRAPQEPSMFQKCLALHLLAAERFRTMS